MPASFLEQASAFTPIIFMVLIIVVFYFVLIRPQQKKDKAVKKMLSELKAGDRITTIGGIFGRIKSIKDEVITIEIGSEKSEMIIARWAIRSVEEGPAENDLI